MWSEQLSGDGSKTAQELRTSLGTLLQVFGVHVRFYVSVCCCYAKETAQLTNLNDAVVHACSTFYAACFYVLSVLDTVGWVTGKASGL